MTDRVATFTQTGQLIANNLRLQNSFAKNQLIVSTGMKAQTYTGISKDTSRLLNLEGDVTRITQQTENGQLAFDRVNLMWSNLGNMLEQTDSFLSDLQTTISGFGLTSTDLSNVATTRLNQVAGALNTQIADRYLFAGSATQTAPVDLTDPAWGGQTFTLPGPSVADTNYYQGNNYIQNVETIDGYVLNYGVTADNSAFEKLIRGYDLIITNPTDQDTLNEAFRIMKEASDEIAVLQASVAQKAKVLESQINDNQEELNLLSEQITAIREDDVAQASVRLKQIETQLEASYTVTATMMNLKLSDYMR